VQAKSRRRLWLRTERLLRIFETLYAAWVVIRRTCMTGNAALKNNFAVMRSLGVAGNLNTPFLLHWQLSKKPLVFRQFFGFVRFALLLASLSQTASAFGDHISLEAAQNRKVWAARSKLACPQIYNIFFSYFFIV